MVLSTVHCNGKIPALLEDQAYRKLKQDPAESVECKALRLMRDFVFLRRFTNNFNPKVQGRQGFTGFQTLSAQARGSLEAHFEHHWGPRLPLSQMASQDFREEILW